MNLKCWREKMSDKYKRIYYVNLESGISQWGIPNNMLPAGWQMHLSKSRKITYYSNFKNKISQLGIPSKDDGNKVPDGWDEMRSSKCKSIYYKNNKTGEVQWIIPHSLSIKPVGIGIPKSFIHIVEDCTQNDDIWKWKETDKIGSGGYGSVYTTCKGMDCDYVVKVQEENKEYYTEIDTLLSLHHTNAVPKVFAAWTCKNFGYFVMEKLYPCEYDDNFMWKEVGKKLDIIREADYLHLDIHNDNVMCNKEGEVVLVDFGFAIKRTDQGDKQEYITKAYKVPLTWKDLEILQEESRNYFFNPAALTNSDPKSITEEHNLANEKATKNYNDVQEKIRKQKEALSALHPDDEGQNRLQPTISIKYFMIVTTKNKYNDRLKKLYIKNYSQNKEFTPEYMYQNVMIFNDMWFHLVNSNDMIIGCCSAKIEDNKYIFDDVYVEEEFRGHNYAKLLLLYAMKSVRTNNDNASFQITVHDYNTPAVKTYSKIFGKPIRVENNMFLYSGITENELEIQLKKVPLVSIV
jgi:GNAT superfamily N-acetyltransferase